MNSELSTVNPFALLRRSRTKAKREQVAYKCPMDYKQLLKPLYASDTQGWEKEYLPDVSNSYWLLPLGLAYLYGLRIAEVLAIRCGDIDKKGNLFIESKKGSNPRVINLPFDSLDYEVLTVCSSQTLVFGCKYETLWRNAVSAGFGTLLKGHKNKSVTHQGRHNFYKSADEHLKTGEAGKTLGHKSKHSADWYANTTDLKKDRERKKRERERKRLLESSIDREQVVLEF